MASAVHCKRHFGNNSFAARNESLCGVASAAREESRKGLTVESSLSSSRKLDHFHSGRAAIHGRVELSISEDGPWPKTLKGGYSFVRVRGSKEPLLH